MTHIPDAPEAESVAILIEVNASRFRHGTHLYLAEPENKHRHMKNPSALRELASSSWYREFAERTDNASIWEARLHVAEDLEAEADRLNEPISIRVDQYKRQPYELLQPVIGDTEI